MIRVLVADDQPLIRQAVLALIRAEPDLVVVGEAEEGATAVELARQMVPDVVVMDLRMPVLDGLEATRQISGDPALSQVKVLVLTTFEDDENVAAALSAGASGFVGKGTDPRTIVEAIRTVHAGESLLSPMATRLLIERYLRRAPVTVVSPLLAELTGREREVLTLIGGGLSNAELAARLVISPLTAKTHVGRIMTKLHAHDRAQLVVFAYDNGLVQPGS